jgi:cytochrome P450
VACRTASGKFFIAKFCTGQLEKPMTIRFISGEFLGASNSERAKKARQMAAEADALAICALNENVRNSYIELKEHWNKLAEEIEQIDAGL